MEKVYENSKDLHIKSLIVYGQALDHTLWADSQCTEYLDAKEVVDAFKKGMLVIASDLAIIKPVMYTGNTFSTVGVSNSAVVLVAWTLAAEEEDSDLDSAA
jgi:hypothetical protein